MTSKLQAQVDDLRRQLSEVAERVRLHDVADAFLRGEHPIRQGDYFLLWGDRATRLDNVSSDGKWTYFDGHNHTEPFRIPDPQDHPRLYTIAEVAEILALKGQR
jgi:hypothetical protein